MEVNRMNVVVSAIMEAIDRLEMNQEADEEGDGIAALHEALIALMPPEAMIAVRPHAATPYSSRWDSFSRDNAEDRMMLAEAAAALLTGKEARIGGGAAPVFALALVAPADAVDPEPVIWVEYRPADVIGNVCDYDEARHGAALREWFRKNKRAVEDAMSDVFWVDFPHDAADLEA